MSMNLADDRTHENTLPPATEVTIRSELGDIVAGLGLAGVAVWFLVEASALPDYSGTAIGAADFPKGLAILLLLGSLGLLGGAVWRLATGQAGESSTIRRPLHVLIGVLLLVAFPLMMSYAGYYLAMGIFLTALLYIAGITRPLLVFGCVAGFLLFTKIIFEMILQTPLS
ncbi:tripartite tricarboxylate transporter TctB family protein [Microvirga makkahensis]|uniref:DUF1468 domain-containing protein n=1 Tax=Microvirga makkahensis TaxID=1128670 RepID=A0A7X3MPC0_9HYPH|nr:tripartite tricarboxylate transporter TctB family protein [Microvirga makkahensis]MXQ10702.1 hypothetical protein [Microvirga makkahensis]